MLSVNIKRDILDSKAEQYYPTYRAQERDILLIEFEEAQKIANGQTKVYGQVTNILLGVVTVLIPLFFEQDKNKIENTFGIIKANSLLFSSIILVFGGLLLRYFVELQRQITVNGRKVVTLRTLLGLDYGSIHLTLPNWRVEGATNPFVIKYFNGWFRFESMPFWVLTIGINIIWWLSTKDRPPFNFLPMPWYVGNIIISAFYLFIFRTNLNDRHETNFLNIVKIFARFFRLKLIENFEYILYRAKLSYLELDRLKVNYESLEKILVDIEDIDFYKNIGFSSKSIARATLSQIPIIRKKYRYIESGGSTITMQLARSLFIPSNQNKFIRKVFEMLLSLWLTGQFTKTEILKLYIASVRYERGILGLSQAIKHFFGDLKSKTLTNEESFFLVERLSNISSTVRWDRIKHLTTRTTPEINQTRLTDLYENQILVGRLKNNQAS